MGNGGVAAIPLQPGDRQGRAIGGDELAHGLTLVRASAMKMARLHLAMERRDRRLVLETMDDLVALDGRIRDFVDEIQTSDGVIDILVEELEEQRIALAREKLTLVAGVSRRDAASVSAEAPSAAAPPSVETAEVERAAKQHLPEAGANHSEGWAPAREEKPPRDWRATLFALAGMSLLIAALAAAAFLPGIADWQETVGRVLQAMEA